MRVDEEEFLKKTRVILDAFNVLWIDFMNEYEGKNKQEYRAYYNTCVAIANSLDAMSKGIPMMECCDNRQQWNDFVNVEQE